MTRKISIYSEQVSPKIWDWNSNQFSEHKNISVFKQKYSKIRFIRSWELWTIRYCQYQHAGFEIVEDFSPILWLIFSNGHFSRLDQYDFEKIFKIVYLFGLCNHTWSIVNKVQWMYWFSIVSVLNSAVYQKHLNCINT